MSHTDDIPRTEVNRKHWDELVPIHTRAASYGLDAFKAGKTSLRSIELAELPDITGKKLLHLQCHFGMDTLSLARMGAEVTGVDFSQPAIDFAQSLAREMQLDARFIWSDIYKLPDVLEDAFDIVYTTYGVLCWLSDLAAWAKLAAGLLKPGGIFYVIDGHPFANILEEDAGRLTPSYSYFGGSAISCNNPGSYADRTADVKNRQAYEWDHPISEIMGAIQSAGLSIQFFHEFGYAGYQKFPSMQQHGEWWHFPDGAPQVPLLFSLMATKPSATHP